MTRSEAAKAIDKLHSDILFGDEEEDIDDTTWAVQHYLSALASLKMAAAQMELAAMTEARERAGNL